MTFSEKLYALRKKQGLSQESLADIVGVSRQAVQKWETGASQPDMNNLLAISRFFSVSVDALVKQELPLSGEPEQEQADTSPLPRGYCPPYRYEYRSSRTLFGLPLVHVSTGRGAPRAKGIVAIGNVATGVIAVGGVAVGLLSFGGLALGLLLAFGGLTVGCVAFGGAAVGLVALGGFAVGYLAYGGFALGIYACGGFAFARDVAVGGRVIATVAAGSAPMGELTLRGKELTDISADAFRGLVLGRFPDISGWILNLLCLPLW